MAEESYRVTLNVYDLSQGLARQLSTSFLGKTIEGIWHTGVVVYGNEYYFGGGIQHCPGGSAPYGAPIRVVKLGFTHIPQEVFEGYLKEISPRYTAEKYSLLTHNCNNFSNEVAQFLVGASIPDYILQLPSEVINSPMGAMILPMISQLESTLRAGAVPQVPQFNPVSMAQAPNNACQISKLDMGSAAHATKTDGASSATTGDKLPSNAHAEAAAAESPKDPLGSARSKVQEEISREFAAIMATRTLRASEAAVLATQRVMQRYGNSLGVQQV